MRLRRLIATLLFLPFSALADTLYQADVGGYSTGVGAGLGVGVTTGYSPYPYSGIDSTYPAGASSAGIPYDTFTYPAGSSCCGCNSCNNCDTSYANRCCH
jgi:hypothetical protein